MNLWAISDLHLSFSVEKSMDVFGDHWKNHHIKLRENWIAMVDDCDTVLMPGDLSWGMSPEDAKADLDWIGKLPGKKLICRGNHDYWWGSLAKTRRMLPPGMKPLQNTAVDIGPAIVAGTRGWSAPEWEGFDPETDEKHFNRELGRMEMALDAAKNLNDGKKPILYMMHYPPVVDGRGTAFASLLSEAGVRLCVYGHLHNSGTWSDDLDMDIDGLACRLVSADFLRFSPALLYDFNSSERRLP